MELTQRGLGRKISWRNARLSNFFHPLTREPTYRLLYGSSRQSSVTTKRNVVVIESQNWTNWTLEVTQLCVCVWVMNARTWCTVKRHRRPSGWSFKPNSRICPPKTGPAKFQFIKVDVQYHSGINSRLCSAYTLSTGDDALGRQEDDTLAQSRRLDQKDLTETGNRAWKVSGTQRTENISPWKNPTLPKNFRITSEHV